MMRFKSAQALQVATLAEGSLVGRLDDFQFALDSGRVFGFRFSKGMFGRIGGAPAEALKLLGKELAYVADEGAIDWSGVARQPVEGRAWAVDYRGTKVMTRRGETVGTVEDVVLALDPARLTGLLLDGERIVELGDAVSLGRDAVVVADPTVPRALEVEDTWWRRLRQRDS
jgi:sporulation protein YlmC with PRC-barrel domain